MGQPNKWNHLHILYAFKPACIFGSIPICHGTTKIELSENKRWTRIIAGWKESTALTRLHTVCSIPTGKTLSSLTNSSGHVTRPVPATMTTGRRAVAAPAGLLTVCKDRWKETEKAKWKKLIWRNIQTNIWGWGYRTWSEGWVLNVNWCFTPGQPVWLYQTKEEWRSCTKRKKEQKVD